MAHSISAPTPADLNIVEEMANYGITYSASDVFHVDGYRYSNLLDAIAQAQRTRSHGATGPNSDWQGW